ncbi:hypothetical protein Salat_2267500 [Sesamum alatum]|uniref:Uncharacterized protein n=1 Tax=Sesamum alatum TaxID=300844 RepID=A0AAE2CDX7_9LAMI|nr:hypothetical protein Salat_2267500 [Sesamum alatum]
MAEPVVNIEQESKHVDNQEGEEEDDQTSYEQDNDTSNLETNTSLLAGLNLVLMVSFLSLSPDECSNFDETQDTESGNHNHIAKHGVSRSDFHARRRQVNQFPAADRQTSKVHTKIRDSRHCRRL